MGWLASSPKEFNGLTRLETLKKRKVEPPMPVLGHELYIHDYWMSLGCALSGVSGPERLTPMFVESWSRGTRRLLSGFEFQLLLDMSQQYVNMHYAGQQFSCRPPYGNSDLCIDRESVSRKIDRQFQSFLNSGRK